MTSITSQGDPRVEVAALLDSYIESFNRQDFDACLMHYALPCTFLSSAQGVVALSSASQFLETMRATSAALRKKGLAKSEFVDKRVRLMDAHIALASCECLRYDAGGNVLARLSGTYNLYKGHDGWKIVTILIHPPETMLAAT